MLVVAGRFFAAVLLLTSLTRPAGASDVTVAGGHFLGALYDSWGEEYGRETGTHFRFAPVGSTTAIERLRKRAVIVAVSAIPLTARALEASGLVQFPVAIGGVVPVVKLPSIEAGVLVLDGPTLARIYLGEITHWNDPSIRALNPSLRLPDQRIKPIYPTGNSGADFLFSSYLSQVSSSFAARHRSGSLSGSIPRSHSGGEVVRRVERTMGALSYVEYEFARRRGLSFARLVNRDGKVVAPGGSTFNAAGMNADWSESLGYYTLLTNQKGAASWPITGASFALMHGSVRNGPAAGEALRFFDWAYNRGPISATEANFAPLPSAVVGAVQNTWRMSIRRGSQPLWLVK